MNYTYKIHVSSLEIGGECMEIVSSTINDLDFLEKLENENFSIARRSSRRSLRNSINSPNQRVFIVKELDTPIGGMILMLYQKQVRVYSIAIKNEYKGKGAGKELIKLAIKVAGDYNVNKIVLEVDTNNDKLVKFYENLGFKIIKTLPNYYGKGEDAYKMSYLLNSEVKNIIITDFNTDFFKQIDNVIHIRAKQYIEDPQYQEMKNANVFNFCQSFQYQSIGYYVCLLALARNQKVFPSLATIRDYKNKLILKSLGEEVFDLMQSTLSTCQSNKVIIDSYFGFCEDSEYKDLIKQMNMLFESPLIRYEFRKNIYWQLDKVTLIQVNSIANNDKIKSYAKQYFSQKRFNQGRFKNYEYDMAILIDENETNPPSDKIALKKFKVAAEKYGFFVEFITKKDYRRIPEFDALFIRATTNVNNYTYDFARYAYSEGLVVIDDPWSILGCSNKLFLYEKMKLNKVKMPKTWLLSKKSKTTEVIESMTYPVILKQPDSAFSLGVHKVKSKEECKVLLEKLFHTSELIIAQDYMPSDFDWRIGVLNGKPIFACRYFMAKGHWQIYNWTGEGENKEGDFDTIPIEKVPQQVLKTAIKATALMGDGLYGVDLKVIGNAVYLIEVNDNPNIDHGIEDQVAGTALYEEIMKLFLDRIENSRNIIRYTSNNK